MCGVLFVFVFFSGFVSSILLAGMTTGLLGLPQLIFPSGD